MDELMTDTPTQSVFIREVSWIKAHLLSLIVVAVLVGGAVYGVEALISARDKAKDEMWKAILAAQSAQTKMLSDKLTQDEQNWTVQNAAQQQLIGQLAASIAKRDQAVKQQQQIDATLSAAAAAERLEKQLQPTGGAVIAQGDNVLLDLPSARQVVSALDLLPAVQADYADSQKQLDAQKVISTNLQANVDGQKGLVSALQTQVGDQVKACQAQVAAVKSKERKNHLKWFGAGVVAGLALHFLGI